MVEDDFIPQITDIYSRNRTEFLPGYFNDRYDLFVGRCRGAINIYNSLRSTNEDLFSNGFFIEIINTAIELNKEFLAYKMRWEIINNIKNIMSDLENREHILKIPVDYSFALPFYLYLLSDLKENFTIQTVDASGNLINNVENIQLERFFFHPPPWSSVEVNIGRLSNEELDHHELTELENEAEEPVTEDSTGSMMAQPGTGHSSSGDDDVENRPPVLFRSFVQHQASFDDSNSVFRSRGTPRLASPSAENLIITPAFYGLRK